MEYSGIYHGMNKRYCYALEKGKFLFRIKTKKDDIKKIVLHTRDKYVPLNFADTRESAVMEKAATDRYNDYYEAVISMDVICLRYFFEIHDYEGNVTYYGNCQFFNEPVENIDDMFDCPQNLREEEMVVIPEWAKNKVVYQIFPARYAASRPVNEQEWYRTPIGDHNHIGGDLKGITEKLPHIKELGVDVIYMTPVFKSDSSHKYDIIDYMEIDEELGTKEDLKKLVTKAHKLGIRVILDAVFNHTSVKFFAFKDVLEKGEDSSYKDWYYIDGFPLEAKRGEKPNFKTFAYYGGMPKLNLRNKETEEYFLNVAKYWIEECDIDGWRLDVADEISHSFWKKFRNAVKSVKSDALIIGEIWHYAGDFLEGDEWDTVMNYHFFLSVVDFVAKGTLKASEFTANMGYMKGNIHTSIFPVLWNLIDSHDTERFISMCKGDEKKFKLAVAIQLLTTGMPMIYYGDEYGITGGPDPDCRRGMLWKDELQNKDIFEYYKKLIQIRKSNKTITEGNICDLYTDDDNGVVVIGKTLDNSEITVIFHNDNKEVYMEKYKGKYNLLSEKVFDGVLLPYETVVLK